MPLMSLATLATGKRQKVLLTAAGIIPTKQERNT